MAVDLRPLHRALTQLSYTTPLDAEDVRYIARPDELGQRILNRVMMPGARRLLLGGPAGGGKSTELLRIHALAHPNYTVFLCPCDRDLDLYKFDLFTLVRYLLWRVVFISTSTNLSSSLKLTSEILRDALACIGASEPFLKSPRAFFSGSQVKPPDVDGPLLFDTFTRLLSEIERAFLRPLLLVDGLEKVPPHVHHDALGEFVRVSILEKCQAIIVVPSFMLHGRESLALYPDVEVLTIATTQDPSFVRDIVARRAGDVLTGEALHAIARYSGGIPRDGLQIAQQACRIAMDDRTSGVVTPDQVRRAKDGIRQGLRSMLSDDPARANTFLDAVRRTGELPGDPDMRNLMLGHGIILPNPDGSFRVHPMMEREEGEG